MTAYLINLGVLLCVNMILAITLNFLLGYAGIYSMAHAIFFGVGAYVSAFVSINYSSSIFILIPLAALITGFISLLLAVPTLRVKGEYFVAASLGLQMIGITCFSEWKSFTGGIGGIVGIPPLRIFDFVLDNNFSFLICSLICLIAIISVCYVLISSSFGRSLKAIRDNEVAALSFGKNISGIKILAVVLTSALSSISGVLYSSYMSFINVESFTIDTSILVMAMVIIGGAGTVLGPIIGALLLLILPSALSYLPYLPQSEVGSIQQILYGAIMVLLMIFRPGGIVSVVGKNHEKN